MLIRSRRDFLRDTLRSLAQWFGVSAGNLPSVFPNIANFGSSNLGFLG